MGEYIKLGGSDAAVKLGTCEDLGYITYDELKWAVAHGAKQCTSSLEPSGYLDPACGWHYRWPFTSEHTGGARTPLTPEAIARRSCDRGGLQINIEGLPIQLAHKNVPVSLNCEAGVARISIPCPRSSGAKEKSVTEYRDAWRPATISICGEKLMPDGTLQTLVRFPVCGAMCRLDEREAELLRVQCKLLAAKMQQRDDLSVEDVEYLNDLLIAARRIKGQPVEAEG